MSERDWQNMKHEAEALDRFSLMVNQWAIDKGFNSGSSAPIHTDQGGLHVSQKLALIHSEVSEALEAVRKGDIENFHEEIADVQIRLFNLCGQYDIPLGDTVIAKMQANENRPHKHGKAF